MTTGFNFSSSIRREASNSNLAGNEARSVSCADSMRRWQDNNMYRTSYYNMSRYNVR